MPFLPVLPMLPGLPGFRSGDSVVYYAFQQIPGLHKCKGLDYCTAMVLQGTAERLPCSALSVLQGMGWAYGPQTAG